MTSGPTSPTLFEQCHGFFHFPFQLKCKDEGDKANGLTSPPNDALIWTEKGVSQLAWSHQFFKDLGWWSGRALNSRLPAPQTGALPTELTGRSPKQTFFLHAILPILRGAETLDEPLTTSAWVASKNIITTHFTKKSTCVVAILTEMKIFQSYRQTGGDKRLEEINKTVLV